MYTLWTGLFVLLLQLQARCNVAIFWVVTIGIETCTITSLHEPTYGHDMIYSYYTGQFSGANY